MIYIHTYITVDSTLSIQLIGFIFNLLKLIDQCKIVWID